MDRTDSTIRSDRREAALPVITERRTEERRLSPMARRVLLNKADGLRTGGDRPMGTDGTASKAVAA